MIHDIARNELRGYGRSGVFIGVAVALIGLMIASSFISTQRMATFERERAAAEIIDSDVWNDQGEQNPHSAAHFSRYAFKPFPELVAFDPGVTDHSGVAVWMEAHFQHPAVFRRAEDIAGTSGFASLSPAWILQYAAPLFLFIVLFSAIAGEREQGMLRQLAASGVTAPKLLIGKLLGAVAGFGVIMVPALLISLFITQANGVQILPDIGARSLGLALVYGVFLVAAGAVAIGVSALARTRRTALIALVAIWSVSFLILPRLGAGAASTLFPTPEAQTIADEMEAASDNWWFGPEENKEAVKQAVLDESGVSTIEELPFNYYGFMLQYSEEDAIKGYEEIYERLVSTYDRQEGVLNAASLFSPVLAVQRLSAGLAGTDRIHHEAFTNDAEAHRRVIIKQLNEDYRLNAPPGGYVATYAAGAELWSQIEDFSHSPPSFAAVWSRYLFDILLLLAYTVGGVAFAWFATRRAQRGIAA